MIRGTNEDERWLQLNELRPTFNYSGQSSPVASWIMLTLPLLTTLLCSATAGGLYLVFCR